MYLFLFNNCIRIAVGLSFFPPSFRVMLQRSAVILFPEEFNMFEVQTVHCFIIIKIKFYMTPN